MVTKEEFEESIKKVLEYVGEDPSREGLVDTPSRVRKAYEFMCGGYNQDPKEILQKALFTSLTTSGLFAKFSV